MFGIIADFLASFVTILFPIFASYKALRTSDPAQLTPWLIYWVILSLFLLFESWTVFIIGWLPFYSWFRLFGLSYLVLPQTQGAKLLYTNYVEPLIANYESQIEAFIGDVHGKLSSLGLHHIQYLINLIRERLLGLPPTTTTAFSPAGPSASYAQSLLSRFTMPTAHAPSDIYSLLSSAMGTTAATATQPSTRSNPGISTLIPPNLTSPSDKASFLSSQREKLSQLMTALDREQRDLDQDLAYGRVPPPERGLEERLEADVARRAQEGGAFSSGFGGRVGGGVEMRKNRSDNSFQNIEREEVDGGGREKEGEKSSRRKPQGRTTSTGWLPTWISGEGDHHGDAGGR